MGAGTADTARIRRKANHREAELYEKIKREVIQKERYHYRSFLLPRFVKNPSKIGEIY